MNYPRIIAKVYAGVWAIKPDVHNAICSALEARLGGARSELPVIRAPEMDEDEDAPYHRMLGAAIIPVHGIIGQHLSSLEMDCGGCDVAAVSDALAMAADDDSVDRIVFDFRSPGGTVTGLHELGQEIAECEKETFAFTDSLCASAAYWIASQADRIYTTETADIGSVGVYAMYLDESRALENEGLKVNAIHAGKWKLLGASFKPMTDEERAKLQSEVDAIRDLFRGDILSRRRIDLSALEGQCFGGIDGAKENLSDGIVRNLREVVDMGTR
jgi:signal peptide peptidase SppA